MSDRIVVLGAGPTGLGAAHRLAELRHEDWDVYERTDHVGGLASSYRDDQGFIWDHGGHVMFSHYTYFDDLVEGMLRGDYDQHMREAWVWMCDRFVPYPLQNNIHRLPDEVYVESLLGIIEAQQNELPKQNFHEWILAIFGRGIAEHFMLPYNFKVWAHPIEMMSTSWQGDRVPEVDLRRIIENHVYDRDDVSWGPNNKFKFPLLGTGMLYERIAEALPKSVEFDHEVAKIDVIGREVHFADGTTTAYDKLITTLPLKELIKRIPEAPPGVVDAVTSLHHTEGLFIGIGVADPCPSTKCWMYFPEDDSPFYRVTYLSNYSPEMTPGPGHFSLLAEVSKSEYKTEDVDDVVDRTIEGLVSSQLLTREQADTKIISRELMHVPYSYPVPTLGRDAALEIIQPWLMSHDVFSRGRFGAWRYEIGNTDHSVMMGVEVIDHLVEGKDETTWSLLPGEEARATIS
ncbi:MAG: FAD-dependent oxidoreductase [Ilumatobacter sp.]|uniref:protoporphyrinogen/coproporphyrinogen oxidase n=1 Tax=Ilumatobacter sp. TaxID=1967498 RepID=UPI003299BCEA